MKLITRFIPAIHAFAILDLIGCVFFEVHAMLTHSMTARLAIQALIVSSVAGAIVLTTGWTALAGHLALFHLKSGGAEIIKTALPRINTGINWFMLSAIGACTLVAITGLCLGALSGGVLIGLMLTVACFAAVGLLWHVAYSQYEEITLFGLTLGEVPNC